MVYVIIIISVGIFLLVRLAKKGNADIANVQKYGGLKKKYSVLINHIMSRNSFYQLQELNINNVAITNTGMVFKLIEIDKKLLITWHWNSFSTGQSYKLKWNFDEFTDQDEMYAMVRKGMTIQTCIDNGMTRSQAEEYYNTNY